MAPLKTWVSKVEIDITHNPFLTSHHQHHGNTPEHLKKTVSIFVVPVQAKLPAWVCGLPVPARLPNRLLTPGHAIFKPPQTLASM